MSGSNAKPTIPAVGADRKKVQHPVVVAVGAPEHWTFEMRETCLPIRTTGVRCSLPALALVLIGAALGGCSGGDFGRTRQDFRNDDMHRWLGAEATGSVGLKASQFQLTDNERQLRDLAYPLIEPPHSRPAWKSVFGDYQPLPSPWRQKVVFDRTTYGRTLIDEPHRSHTSRYQQLIEDGLLSAGHGRALLAIADSSVRLELARRAAKGGMSVRQVERLATRGPRTAPVATSRNVDPNAKAALEELSR